MKINEKQLQILFHILTDSIKTDIPIFSFSLKTREELYQQIIQQQSTELVEIK